MAHPKITCSAGKRVAASLQGGENQAPSDGVIISV
jgi:hypothetical protein